METGIISRVEYCTSTRDNNITWYIDHVISRKHVSHTPRVREIITVSTVSSVSRKGVEKQRSKRTLIYENKVE